TGTECLFRRIRAHPIVSAMEDFDGEADCVFHLRYLQPRFRLRNVTTWRFADPGRAPASRAVQPCGHGTAAKSSRCGETTADIRGTLEGSQVDGRIPYRGSRPCSLFSTEMGGFIA